MTHLFEQNTTLSLSTSHKDGGLWTSSAPFAVQDGKAYIFISGTAEHCENLMQEGKASFMVVEDEQKAKNPFVLERVSFQSKATALKEIPDSVWTLFLGRFPKEMLEQLRKMNFHMFELTMEKGRYVSDFGKAFDVAYQDGAWKQEGVTDVTMRMG